jgi:hypothetical protein
MAYRQLPPEMKELNEKTVEDDFVFVGLTGMIDPPRSEAIEANKKCEKAGIRAVMITGDHKLTAVAVAKEIGIMKEGSLVLAGSELNAMSDEEFDLIKPLGELPAVIARAAEEYEPSLIAVYMLELAMAFNVFLAQHRVLGEEERITQARVLLTYSVREVLATCLRILGMEPLERM